MTPQLVSHEGAVVLGIDVTTSNAAEANPAKGRIPALWEQFYRENVLARIPRQVTPGVPYAVYTDYVDGMNGRYRLLVGAAVEPGTMPPDHLKQATISVGSYLVFRAEGEMPRVIIETWMAIWNYFSEPRNQERAYTSDFEVYPGPQALEIHIAVK
jgi:predicted transcriptional regulator YdeE